MKFYKFEHIENYDGSLTDIMIDQMKDNPNLVQPNLAEDLQIYCKCDKPHPLAAMFLTFHFLSIFVDGRLETLST